MKATAISSRLSAIWAAERKGLRRNGVIGAAELSRTIRRCPAIILAASRTARVPGRIRFLMVSIITINGIRADGVPCGIKCASKLEVLFSQPNMIAASQAGRAKDKVKQGWLEAVKMYGSSPSVLLNIITTKKETPAIKR